MADARPLLLIDIDGVISLWGFDVFDPPPCVHCLVDGHPHHLSLLAAQRLLVLARSFECVWCSGWEDRAEMNLPFLLGLPGGWPHIEFGQAPAAGARHWKLEAIDAFTGPDRAIAWIDDAHDPTCAAWLAARRGPGLLVATDPASGLLDEHVERLLAWAGELQAGR